MRAVLSLIALVLAGCGPAGGPGPTPSPLAPLVFDLGREFSFTANPNGPWRYGYTTGTQLTRAAFARMTVVEPAPPVSFWHPGPGREGYYPYIAAAQPGGGQRTAADPTGSWALRPGEVALEAGNTGQFAAIEFTVPSTGTFAISADFTGIHKGVSTTDAHVMLGDEELYTADISGASPTASYRETRALNAGDVLTFAIGYGLNGTHYNDTTGLILTIRRS